MASDNHPINGASFLVVCYYMDFIPILHALVNVGFVRQIECEAPKMASIGNF